MRHWLTYGYGLTDPDASGDGYGAGVGFNDGDGVGDMDGDMDGDRMYDQNSAARNGDGVSRNSFISTRTHCFVPSYIVGDFEASVMLAQLVIHKEKR